MPFKGAAIEDIYNGIGPWNYSTLPIVVSTYHTILYQLKPNLKSPPEPHASGPKYHWEDGYVRIPYSSRNLYPSKDDDGKDAVVSRWELINQTLQQSINSSRALEAAISAYNNRLPKFHALHHLFEQTFDDHESKHFLTILLPGIVKLALQLEEILPGNIPLLSADHCKSVSFSQKQIASLLANAFLCTFSGRRSISGTYPSINFVGLFSANNNGVIEKIKCIIHYFKRVLDDMPCGVVTFERQHINRASLPRWDQLTHNLGNVRVHITSEGTIEDDGLGLLQVDFANKFLGGGVLGSGCVQEEIRFVICPELLVSRLFFEKMNNNEAVIITGVERFSRYKGYGDTFEWDGNFVDETPFDAYGRRRTSVVAIDATLFSRSLEQFKSGQILRELNKAYVGFHSRATGQLSPVATGNWGCGAFGGNVHLKFLIQLMACSAAHRDLVYFTFGSSTLRDELYNMYAFLATQQVRITELWRLLCQYPAAGLKPDQFFPFLQQAYFDAKKQPKISEAFGHLHAIAKQQTFGKLESSGSLPMRRVKTPPPAVEEPILRNNHTMDVEPLPEASLEKKVREAAITSPTVLKRKRKTSGTLPSTDLISVISKIDGSPAKSSLGSSGSENNASWGFLNCVDEYSTHASKTERCSVPSDTVVDCPEEFMDVEDILVDLSGEKTPRAQNSLTNLSTPKKKITDYFKKP